MLAAIAGAGITLAQMRVNQSIFTFWIEQGVKVFRVDNPHTKSLYFWEWCLQSLKAEQPGIPIVFDPVMVATSGADLADEPTIAAFGRLMDVATIATPNLPELNG